MRSAHYIQLLTCTAVLTLGSCRKSDGSNLSNNGNLVTGGMDKYPVYLLEITKQVVIGGREVEVTGHGTATLIQVRDAPENGARHKELALLSAAHNFYPDYVNPPADWAPIAGEKLSVTIGGSKHTAIRIVTNPNYQAQLMTLRKYSEALVPVDEAIVFVQIPAEIRIPRPYPLARSPLQPPANSTSKGDKFFYIGYGKPGALAQGGSGILRNGSNTVSEVRNGNIVAVGPAGETAPAGSVTSAPGDSGSALLSTSGEIAAIVAGGKTFKKDEGTFSEDWNSDVTDPDSAEFIRTNLSTTR